MPAEFSLEPAGDATEDVAQAIRGTFQRLGKQRPTIVFLDDLQWADDATLTVLAN